MVVRVVCRTLVRSAYLLTAPVTAAMGLVLLLGAMGVWVIGSVAPGGSHVSMNALTVARWPGDVEWWRISAVCDLTGGSGGGARRPRSGKSPASVGFGLWLDLTHSVAVLPVVMVTWVATAMWWSVGVATATSPLRSAGSGSLRPMTLYLGSADSHVALSLGLTTPGERRMLALAIAAVVLVTLPLVVRLCFAVQAGLGRELLSTASTVHRRISGLEYERDTARASAVAAVTAEADALRRLERDIHDGPQQQLVRLAMELGRAQHHFDTRPELVRAALADAVDQTQETLDELRALSRGIAPPILADRGLPAALSALAARSVIPVELDVDSVSRPLVASAETAAYFVVAEALANIAKHSQARRCTIGMRDGEGCLRVWVTDDGVGGAALAKGHGLQGLADRALAVSGRLIVNSPEGGPTTITAELPCR